VLTNKLNIYRIFIKYCICILWITVNLSFRNLLKYSELLRVNYSVIWTNHFILNFIRKTAPNCRFKISNKRFLIRMFWALTPKFRVALEYYRVNLSIFCINSRIHRAFRRNIRGVLQLFFIQVTFFLVTLSMFRRLIRMSRAFCGSFGL